VEEQVEEYVNIEKVHVLVQAAVWYALGSREGGSARSFWKTHIAT
jgi:hypothetical protein